MNSTKTIEYRTEEQEHELAMNFYRRFLGEEPIYKAPPVRPNQWPREAHTTHEKQCSRGVLLAGDNLQKKS